MVNLKWSFFLHCIVDLPLGTGLFPTRDNNILTICVHIFNGHCFEEKVVSYGTPTHRFSYILAVVTIVMRTTNMSILTCARH